MTERANVVVRRTDEAIVVEAQAVRAEIEMRSRPIAAVAADRAQTVIAEAAMTRRRIPDAGRAAELAGEVHAFVSAII